MDLVDHSDPLHHTDPPAKEEPLVDSAHLEDQAVLVDLVEPNNPLLATDHLVKDPVDFRAREGLLAALAVPDSDLDSVVDRLLLRLMERRVKVEVVQVDLVDPEEHSVHHPAMAHPDSPLDLVQPDLEVVSEVTKEDQEDKQEVDLVDKPPHQATELLHSALVEVKVDSEEVRVVKEV